MYSLFWQIYILSSYTSSENFTIGTTYHIMLFIVVVWHINVSSFCISLQIRARWRGTFNQGTQCWIGDAKEILTKLGNEKLSFLVDLKLNFKPNWKAIYDFVGDNCWNSTVCSWMGWRQHNFHLVKFWIFDLFPNANFTPHNFDEV